MLPDWLKPFIPPLVGILLGGGVLVGAEHVYATPDEVRAIVAAEAPFVRLEPLLEKAVNDLEVVRRAQTEILERVGRIEGELDIVQDILLSRGDR